MCVEGVGRDLSGLGGREHAREGRRIGGMLSDAIGCSTAKRTSIGLGSRTSGVLTTLGP